MSIQTKYFPFMGGLNTTAPPLSVRPGELLDCMNYECLQEGGYQRIRGYESIGLVPGDGPILGVHIYRGDYYAIRDDAGAGKLYKHNGTEWVRVGTKEWSPQGQYKFHNYNFYGQDSQEEMFIVNGIDKCVKFDGTTLEDINTGAITDNPSNVIGYKYHLVLSLESSLMGSNTGDPTAFDAATGGAFEIAVGDTIREFKVSQGALIIGCRESTKVLYGNDANDFQLEPFSNSGMYSFTAANVGGQIIALDDSGVMSLQATQAFGNFVYGSVSERVRNEVAKLSGNGNVRTTVNRSKGQYRFFSGHNGLYFSFTGQQLLGITKIFFDHPVLCLANGDDSSGAEITLFGSDDGHVYCLDRTNFFEGEKMPSFLLLAFHTFGLPTQNKRYRQILVDAKFDGAVSRMYVLPITDYGGGIGTIANQFMGRRTGGGFWDVGFWDDLVWDEQSSSELKARINVTGGNMGVVISSENESDGVHAIYGATIHFSPRRLRR